MGKVNEYFKAGPLCVWVVYPNERPVQSHVSPNKAIIFGEGNDLLPGFRLSLIDRFEDGLPA